LESLSEYLISSIPTNLLILAAALTGTRYLRLRPKELKAEVILVLFLWITFIVEAIGAVVPIAKYTGYRVFGFIEDTVFEENAWVYNPFMIMSYLVYAYYIRSHVKKGTWKKLLYYAAIVFAISSMIFIFWNNIYFEMLSLFTIFTGTLLITITCFRFFMELLRSDKILSLRLYLPFYIAIGVLMFNLCITPLIIYASYFSAGNDLYIKLHSYIVLFSNLFMYSCFIIGFLICKKNKSSLLVMSSQ